jgi:predicted DCC family thiol-disulfide oxidoreductase YuxK
VNQLSNPVVLFDGVCNLCCNTVQFIIQHDPKQQFRFAQLQSNAGKALLTKHPCVDATNMNSVILLMNNRVYTKSTAALLIAKKLKGFWPLLYTLIIIPTFIRDAVYAFIAQNRYRWFGKKATCWLPNDEISTLFLH